MVGRIERQVDDGGIERRHEVEQHEAGGVARAADAGAEHDVVHGCILIHHAVDGRTKQAFVDVEVEIRTVDGVADAGDRRGPLPRICQFAEQRPDRIERLARARCGSGGDGGGQFLEPLVVGGLGLRALGRLGRLGISRHGPADSHELVHFEAVLTGIEQFLKPAKDGRIGGFPALGLG